MADNDCNVNDLTEHVQDTEEDGETDADDESGLSSADDTESDAEKSHQAYLLNLKERELIKFLVLVERGEGMSTAKAEDILSYIKTFSDARAQLLPKKMKTCWLRVDKVPFPCCYYTVFCNLIFK